MKKFKQLILKHRYQISSYKIAQMLNVSESTISKELKRNVINGKYIAEEVAVLSYNRHTQ